jgi:hypothetical protein
MSDNQLQKVANYAKVGLILLWAIFMYSLISNS